MAEITIIFGRNPVKGGSPAKDINRIKIDRVVRGEEDIRLFNCEPEVIL